DGIRDPLVTGVQTCALPILSPMIRSVRLVAGFVMLSSGIMYALLIGSVSQLALADGEHAKAEAAQRMESLIKQLGSNSFADRERSEERRVGKECRGRWWEAE